MNQDNPFKWRHYQPEVILLCVRWSLRYSLSYRDLEEISVFVPNSKPLMPQCPYDSWRVDETYIKVRGTWMYLYRAVDCVGNTLELWSSC